jgi:hypothetical protein
MILITVVFGGFEILLGFRFLRIYTIIAGNYPFKISNYNRYTNIYCLSYNMKNFYYNIVNHNFKFYQID